MKEQELRAALRLALTMLRGPKDAQEMAIIQRMASLCEEPNPNACEHTARKSGERHAWNNRVPDAGPAAGGVEFEQICQRCTASRWVALNGNHRCDGAWFGKTIKVR